MAHKNTLEQKRTRRLQKQLTAYSVAAGAALALVNPTDASIVHNTGFTGSLSVSPGNPVAIDINGAGGNDFNFTALTSTLGPFTDRGVLYAIGVNAGAKVRVPAGMFYAINFSTGEPIVPGTSGLWQTHPVLQSIWNGAGAGPFNGLQGYIGIIFSISGNQHLGWIQYQGDLDSPTGTILGWAYESNPSTPINAGAVPLPGTFGLGLLALGAAGVARLRHRKKEAKEETA